MTEADCSFFKSRPFTIPFCPKNKCFLQDNWNEKGKKLTSSLFYDSNTAKKAGMLINKGSKNLHISPK